MFGDSGPGVGGLLQAPLFLLFFSCSSPRVRRRFSCAEWRGRDIEDREEAASLLRDGDRDSAALRLLPAAEVAGRLGEIVADLGLALRPRLPVKVSIILEPPPPARLVMMLAAGLRPLSLCCAGAGLSVCNNVWCPTTRY